MMTRLESPQLRMRRRSLIVGGLAASLGCPTGRAADPPAASPASPPIRSPHVGINLAGLAYWATQFPFADLTKNGGGWGSRDARGAEVGKLALAPSGEPAALEPGQRAYMAVAWEDTRYAAGEYVVRWDGDGELSFPNSAVRIASRAPGRIALEVRDTRGQLWISIDRSNPANPLRNVRFLWPGTEATIATQPFNPEFLRRLAPFSCLRFMDWGATNGSPLVRWADRPRVEDAVYTTTRGVPVERMIDLANALQADPWFCIPHLADDDYVRQFALLVRGRLDPRRVASIEYSNEVWNGSFAQARHAVEQARRLGLATPAGFGSLYYAERTGQIVALVDTVFGAAERKRWRMILSGQAAWTQFGADALGWKSTAARVDAYAVAPYFNAQPAADPAKVEATLALAPDAILEQMRAHIRGAVRSHIVDSAKLAAQHKLPLLGYEGGAHDSSSYFPPDKQDPMTALFSAAHRSPRMRDIYREYLETWIAAGGGLMNQYNDIGRWSKWGLWGLLEHVTQDPSSAPKYLGLLDTIAAHPARQR
jgi:hypothetical protein